MFGGGGGQCILFARIANQPGLAVPLIYIATGLHLFIVLVKVNCLSHWHCSCLDHFQCSFTELV